MSIPTKVDVAIAGKHISGARLSDLGTGAPIALPAGTPVVEGSIIKVDGTLCKVTGVVYDRVNYKEMSVNIYTAPVEQ